MNAVRQIVEGTTHQQLAGSGSFAFYTSTDEIDAPRPHTPHPGFDAVSMSWAAPNLLIWTGTMHQLMLALKDDDS